MTRKKLGRRGVQSDPPFVTAGLVPAVHWGGGGGRRGPARTARLDALNKSGHEEWQKMPVRAPYPASRAIIKTGDTQPFSILARMFSNLGRALSPITRCSPKGGGPSWAWASRSWK